MKAKLFSFRSRKFDTNESIFYFVNSKSETAKVDFFLTFLSIFEITRTIYSNSEKSEQSLVKQNAFLTCSWRFLISNELEQFKLEKIIGILKEAGKVLFSKSKHKLKK